MKRTLPKNTHLGGHQNKTNIDKGLLIFLTNTLKIKTILDIGCGPGGMVDLGLSLNLDAWGVDGDSSVKKNSLNPDRIIIQDFTTGQVDLVGIGDIGSGNVDFDLGYSCEFLEHVDKKYMNNYMALFKRCRCLVFTCAPPKWPGVHHVNCQNHDFWLNAFGKHGFLYDHKMTKLCRERSTMNIKRPFRKQFIKQRVLFMYNTKFIKEVKLDWKPGKKLIPGCFGILPTYIYLQTHKPFTLRELPNHLFETQLPYNSLISTIDNLEEHINNIRSEKIYLHVNSQDLDIKKIEEICKKYNHLCLIHKNKN